MAKALTITICFLMSYLNMQGKITIGDLVFTSFNSFGINESIVETSDQATITLARNYKELRNKSVMQQIKAGMPVTIEAGYDNELAVEFTGYVKPPIPAGDFPVIIKCDELYPLRQNNFSLSYRNVTLKNLLGTICPGYTIEGVDTDLGKIRINNQSTVQIINYLKKEYGFYTRIYGKVLHCGFAFDFSPNNTKRHDYTFGQNVKDYSDLKFETDRAYNTRVEVYVRQPDGKKKVYKFGSEDSEATVRREELPNMAAGTAEKKAQAIFHQYTYDGYTGSVIGFGIPRVHAGDSIKIINPVYPDREGIYLVEKTEINYEEAKLERVNHISHKLAS